MYMYMEIKHNMLLVKFLFFFSLLPLFLLSSSSLLSFLCLLLSPLPFLSPLLLPISPPSFPLSLLTRPFPSPPPPLPIRPQKLTTWMLL